MSQPQLRQGSQAAFQAVRAYFAATPLARGELVPVEIARELAELGIADRGRMAQWGIAQRHGFLLLHDRETPQEELLPSLISDDRIDRILVYKAGQGYTALAASRCADFVVAVESSPRLRQMLEFHLRLNGIDNVIVRPGVEDRARYSLILIPNLEQESIEATLKPAGGGEKSAMRTVNRAIPHLESGGTLLAAVTVSWRDSVQPDAQVREWFPAAEGCSVSLFTLEEHSPAEFAIAMLRRANPLAGTLEECYALLSEADSTGVADAVLLIHRPATGEGRVAVRTLSHPLDAAAIQRSIRRERMEHSAFLSARPRLGTNWKLRESFQMRDGKFVSGREALQVDAPWKAEFPFPMWLKTMLPLVNGERTVSEIANILREGGVKEADALFGLSLLASYEVILVD
jgi:hypothetical protein